VADLAATRDASHLLLGRRLRTTRLLIAVFPPSEIDDQKVEKGDDDQCDRMCVSKAVKLVAAEKAENYHGCWISPQRIEPKGGDKESLNQAVQDEIDRREVPGARQVLRSPEEMIREELMPIKGQIMLEEEQSDAVQR
jgi:hypothetical protein